MGNLSPMHTLKANHFWEMIDELYVHSLHFATNVVLIIFICSNQIEGSFAWILMNFEVSKLFNDCIVNEMTRIFIFSAFTITVHKNTMFAFQWIKRKWLFRILHV